MARREGLPPWNVRGAYRNNNNSRNRNNNNGLRVANHSAGRWGQKEPLLMGGGAAPAENDRPVPGYVVSRHVAEDEPPLPPPVGSYGPNVGMGPTSYRGVPGSQYAPVAEVCYH